ncbi:hypothetical protein Agub_g5394 [Astrephomene gubernaculifera]|uniref:U-box domain-containing protein n=1 Tax=Astrephomene gubernaculifera TaxID=47775 RepID=A0AAD3HKR5_9CHLO|nr:hypothetical protein Agub_g5394 [Astrephomene gubernaculifera]
MAGAWTESEVFQLTMQAGIETVISAKGKTIKVFHRAGFRKLADIYPPQGQEDVVREVARQMAVEDGTEDLGYWRAMGTRCVTVIRRVRSAEAAPIVPDHFICPITNVLMEDPVITSAGITYERYAIERALAKDQRDPIARMPISPELIPNRALQDAIEHYNMHFHRYAVPPRVPAWAL